MIPQTLGERLRVAMRAANIRNIAIAAAVGVHVKTVSRWLSDRAVPEATHVLALASLLDVHADWLGRGEGPMRDGTRGSHLHAEARGPRLPPDVYRVVHEYVTRLDQASVPAASIEEAERLMIGAAFSKLTPSDPRDRSDADMIADVSAIWAFVHQVLTRDGYELGRVDVRTRRLTKS